MYEKKKNLFGTDKLAKIIILSLMAFNLLQADAVRIIGNGVNIRTGPSVKYRVLTSVKKGTLFERVKTSGRWVKIRLSNGRNAWVAKGYTYRMRSAEVRRGCWTAEVAGDAGGGIAAMVYGKFAATAICCGATGGWGCLVCKVGTTALIGATSKYFITEEAEKVMCD